MQTRFYSLLVMSVSILSILGCTKGSVDHPQKQAFEPIPVIEPKPVEPVIEPKPAIEPIPSQFKPGEVSSLCDSSIAKVSERLNVIESRQKEKQTVENTLMAFETAMADLADEATPLTFMGYVSTNEKISEEGSSCEQKLGQLTVDIFTRRSLYLALKGQTTKNPDQERLLKQTLQNFEQNGLKLDDDKLAQVKKMKSELSTKESDFSENLNADTSSVAFTADQLKGATADFLQRLNKTEDGKYIVTTKSTDYLEVMQHVSVPETRKAMLLAYLNRAAGKNTKLLEEAVQIRSKLGPLLGFANWADYRISTRMAKSSGKALGFLNGLKSKLAERNSKDQQELLDAKKKDDPTAVALNQWDNAYYSYKLQSERFNLNYEAIKEYFPADVVVAGIFDVYSKLLSVKYVEVTDAIVWAEGVKLYEIRNGSDSELIGYFYTDLIPRAGKYGHAAAFSLVMGRNLNAVTYSHPISAIVANFSPPNGDKPSLLSHDEVETFFHEFGHIMHQTLTKAPYASLSGSSVAQDFVEAPSQMLENWVWSPKILSQISGHYQNHANKLPENDLKNLINAKNFQQGALYTKQLLYALYDMTLHTSAEGNHVDVTKTYDSLYLSTMGQKPLEGAHFAASFGHLMGGYDAGYYGYLWSEVYAQDMFSIFPADDLTNAEVGGRYRKIILESGSMKDASELLVDFLGREPNAKAFYLKLGITEDLN